MLTPAPTSGRGGRSSTETASGSERSTSSTSTRHRAPGVGRRAEPAPARHAPGAGPAAPGFARGRQVRVPNVTKEQVRNAPYVEPDLGLSDEDEELLAATTACGVRVAPLRPSPLRGPDDLHVLRGHPNRVTVSRRVHRGRTCSVGGGPTTRRRTVWRPRRAATDREGEAEHQEGHGHGLRGTGHGLEAQDAAATQRRAPRTAPAKEPNGIFSELKDTAKDAALDVLKPVIKEAASRPRATRPRRAPR